MKFAAIDIGSNAVRLLIEEVFNDGKHYHIEKVSFTRVPVRLGEDVFSKGKISREKTRQLIKTMKAFWYLMDVHQIEYFMACATSAMRDATNRRQVIAAVKKEANIKIEVLTGDQEADLIFSNSKVQPAGSRGSFLYIDVGGGSTELTLMRNRQRVKSKSFELGTVRALAGTVKRTEWEKAERWVQNTLKPGTRLTAIGTGGNINTVFKLSGKKPAEMLTYTELSAQYRQLKALSLEERITRMKLKPDRADVIIPACEIYLRIMRLAGIKQMIVPKIGLSDGIILDLFTRWQNKEL